MIDFLAFLVSLSAVEAIWIPAAIAAGSVLLAPPRRVQAATAAGCVAAVWIGVLLMRPIPVLPPIGGVGWMLFASLAGLFLALATLRPRRRLAGNLAFALVLPAAVTVLIGRTAYASVLGTPAWAAFGLLAAAGIGVCARLAQQGENADMPRAVFLASCGLAALGWLYGTRLGLHAMTVAAALGGVLLAARLAGRDGSKAISFAGGAAYFALAVTMIFWSDAFVLPVAATFLVFFAGDVAAALTPKESLARHRLQAFLAVLFAAGAPIGYLYGG